MSNWRSTSLGVVLIAACCLLLYGRVTSLFWTYDDAFNLSFADRFTPVDYFLSRDVARTLPFRMFTPLLFGAYDIDLALFGYRAELHYAHLLVSLIAMVVVVSLIYRFWFKPPLALLGALLVLLSPAAVEWAVELMARHYVDGALLSALATLFFLRSVESKRRLPIVVAAVLYLAACLAKEIYVPLPALWLLLPLARWRLRLQHTAPSLVAAAIYLVWRVWMIGTLGGGYGWATVGGERISTLLKFPQRLIEALSPEQRLFAYTLLAATVVALVIKESRRFATTALGAAILSVAPLVAVAQQIEPRYVVLLSVVMSTTVVAAIAKLMDDHRRAAAALFTAIFTMVLLVSNRIAWNSMFEESRRMSVETRAFLDLSSDDVLARPIIPPGAAGELRQMATRVYGRPSSPAWFYDELYLCSNRGVGKRLWRYSSQSRSVVDATTAIQSEASRFCAALKVMPLNGQFEKDGEILGWNLGPYEDGSYRFVLDEGTMAYDMPRSSHFKVGAVSVLPLRIRYDSPAGWTTYSPELRPDFTSSRNFSWSR